MKPQVDWSEFKWDKPLITCRCGKTYYTHSKLVLDDNKLVKITKDPCPGCGSDIDHVVRAEYPPERIELGQSDLGKMS